MDEPAGSGTPGPITSADDPTQRPRPSVAEAPGVTTDGEVALRPDDRTPQWLTRLHARTARLLPAAGRLRVAAIAGLVIAGLTIGLAGLRLLLRIADGLDILAYLGLFVTNWIANGGLLVPVPGLRFIGWVMIVQQGAALDPTTAGVVGGLAMALGQVSLYVAADAAAQRSATARHAAARSRGSSRLGRAISGDRARRARDKLDGLLRHHGFATILGLSMVPNPLTSLGVGMAGAMGMGFRRFLAATLIGRLILGLALAWVGQGLLDLATGWLR